ncbi:hypothetical protein PMIN06_007785 [Paraphaeosphaeria minitans]
MNLDRLLAFSTRHQRQENTILLTTHASRPLFALEIRYGSVYVLETHCPASSGTEKLGETLHEWEYLSASKSESLSPHRNFWETEQLQCDISERLNTMSSSCLLLVTVPAIIKNLHMYEQNVLQNQPCF